MQLSNRLYLHNSTLRSSLCETICSQSFQPTPRSGGRRSCWLERNQMLETLTGSSLLSLMRRWLVYQNARSYPWKRDGNNGRHSRRDQKIRRYLQTAVDLELIRNQRWVFCYYVVVHWNAVLRVVRLTDIGLDYRLCDMATFLQASRIVFWKSTPSLPGVPQRCQQISNGSKRKFWVCNTWHYLNIPKQSRDFNEIVTMASSAFTDGEGGREGDDRFDCRLWGLHSS